MPFHSTIKSVLITALLFSLLQCKNPTPPKKESKTRLRKYTIIIERTSQSLTTGREVREDRIDSILTVSNEVAYDSCMGMLYGERVAETAVTDDIKRSGKKGDFRYLYRKVIGYKVLNDQGEDVVSKIADSAKRRIDSFWLSANIRP